MKGLRQDPMKGQELIDAITDLARQGASYRETMQQLGISLNRVSVIRSMFGYALRQNDPFEWRKSNTMPNKIFRKDGSMKWHVASFDEKTGKGTFEIAKRDD